MENENNKNKLIPIRLHDGEYFLPSNFADGLPNASLAKETIKTPDGRTLTLIKTPIAELTDEGDIYFCNCMRLKELGVNDLGLRIIQAGIKEGDIKGTYTFVSDLVKELDR